MNQKRAFLISGAATMAVLLLLGGALFARQGRVWPAEVAASAATQSDTALSTSEIESQPSLVVNQELQVAYADLDAAYREIERLESAAVAGQDNDHDEHGSDDDEGDEDDR